MEAAFTAGTQGGEVWSCLCPLGTGNLVGGHVLLRAAETRSAHKVTYGRAPFTRNVRNRWVHRDRKLGPPGLEGRGMGGDGGLWRLVLGHESVLEVGEVRIAPS